MRRFEYSDAKSAKFWEIEVEKTSVTTRWGRVGSDGQSKAKSFASSADARKEAEKQIRAKTKKGYEEIAGSSTSRRKKTAAKKAAPGKAAPKTATTKKAAPTKTSARAAKTTAKTKKAARSGQTANSEPAVVGAEGWFLGGPRRTGTYPGPGPRKRPSCRWLKKETNANGDEWGGDLVVADGRIFGASSGYNAHLAALSLAGKALWNTQLGDKQAWPASSFCVADGVVYATSNHGVYALDAGKGTILWLSKTSGINGSAPLVHDGLCFVGSKGYLNAIDIETGRKSWRMATTKKASYETQSSPAFADGILYFRGGETLWALDPAHKGKKVKWKVRVNKLGNLGPAVIDDLILIGAKDRSHQAGIEALARDTGKSVWRCELEGLLSGTLAVSRGVVVCRDGEGAIVAVDLATGVVKWRHDRGGKCHRIGRTAPCIADDVVYAVMVERSGINSSSTFICAFDLASGKRLWEIERKVSWHGNPIVHGGKLLVQAGIGVLVLG